MNALKAQVEEIIRHELIGSEANPYRRCPKSGLVSIRLDSGQLIITR